MIGLGFVCFAVFMVGGSLLLTLVMTLLAMQHAAREELSAAQIRGARSQRRNLVEPVRRPFEAAMEVGD